MAITPYDEARRRKIQRTNPLSGELETLEPGVNFFVEALESMGAVPFLSCQGHPTGFRVVFKAPYMLAFAIEKCGYFSVSLMRWENGFVMSIGGSERGITIENGDFTEADRDEILGTASLVWRDNLLNSPKVCVYH